MRILDNGTYIDAEEKEAEIYELKKQLAESNYKAIKYAEGWYTEEEYAPIKAQREALRERIREMEAKI